MLTRSPVRHLGESERSAVERLLERDPIAAAQVIERIAARGLSWWRSDGKMLGYGQRRELQAICWAGAHVTPLATHREAVAAFAETLARQARTCGSIVGPAEGVLELWAALSGLWGPSREVRTAQPLLLADAPSPVAEDPLVRPVALDELDKLMPASIAMYTEEVGVSPVDATNTTGYRSRVATLVRGSRSYARFHGDTVVFKADVAVLTRHTAQIQGVWVHPEWRGQGLATSGMSTVVNHVLRRFAPTVSLYVNDYNVPARRAYDRCGFRQVGEFATVLF
ncbi:putative GNAT family acetyltransferase [Allocatelliglobosispora scoriae]|uniref:Putative GNAT family acetyltransferase n=1 Tax=Allocatelliglobosispora scoriae TaxID=643052 RepID=A0A841BZX6_9ACTN|nr:putative GNAT family acetyltransferase [Allocatelliglobosispora scoriae]